LSSGGEMMGENKDIFYGDEYLYRLFIDC
jgi:hypothetical protein